MNLYLGEAITVTLKTMPFLLLRAFVYCIVGAVSILYFLLIGGVAALLVKIFGEKAGGITTILFILATVGFFGLIRLVRMYVLYLLKAGHIAVISHIIVNGELPAHQNQVEFGKQFVKNKVKDVSILFVIDRLVDGVLRAINNTVARISSWLPLPGLENVGKLVNMVTNFAITFIDEAILSYSLVKGGDNLWQNARTGLVLYAQRWKNILLASAILGFINWVAVGVMLILALPIVYLLPFSQNFKFIGFIIAAIIAYLIRLAVIYPFAMTSIIITYHKEIEGVQPDLAWETKLDTLSAKFRKLGDRALETIRHKEPNADAV